jgi:hypothetical protein
VPTLGFFILDKYFSGLHFTSSDPKGSILRAQLLFANFAKPNAIDYALLQKNIFVQIAKGPSCTALHICTSNHTHKQGQITNPK